MFPSKQIFGVLCALLLSSCAPGPDEESDAPELSRAQQGSILRELQALIEREYVVPDGAALLTTGLEIARSEGLFDESQSVQSFVTSTNLVLQSAYPDPHLGVLAPARYQEVLELFYGGEESAGSSQKEDTSGGEGHAVVQHHQPRSERSGAAHKAGLTLLEVAGISSVSEINRDGLNQIAYLAFERLIDSERSRNTLQRIFETFSESERMILDLRECRGGDAGMVIALSSYFFEAPTHLLSSVNRRDENGEQRIEERWTTPMDLSPVFASKPLDILVSERTFSAAESLAFGLKSVGRARIIGAPTGGGGFSNDFFPLGEGLGVSLSIGRTFDPRTGDGWQVTGIVPDVQVPWDQALSEIIGRITEESGKLAKLTPQEREILDQLQAYTYAWYNADREAMGKLIAADFAASHTTRAGVTGRDRAEQLAATEEGLGVQERLYHNRIIRNIQVQGERASAELVLRSTSHQIELRRGGEDWQVVRDTYEDKRLSG